MPDSPSTAESRPLLEVQDLAKRFVLAHSLLGRPKTVLTAVDEVSFRIAPGEAVGLVGESGCGKTTVGKLVLRLLTPTKGRVVLKGEEISRCGERAMAPHRRVMQMIFQDPYGSLSPRMSVGDYIAEPLVVHSIGSRDERRQRVRELLEKTGLDAAQSNRFPHEFSGGQRQRIAIARALSLGPQLVIADEPVSALDLSIQASVLNLMRDLQEELQLSYLFISHDISVVHYMCQRILIMYLGKIVESADRDTIFARPHHPYTRALLDSVPIPDPRRRDRDKQQLGGDVPSPLAPPSGCRFRTRCPKARDKCRELEPPLREVAPGAAVACHFPEM